MTTLDILGIGNAIVDVLARADEDMLVRHGMAKGGMRGYAARLMFPDREEWLDRHGWAYFWLTPIATWIWLYAFARSAVTRRIEWRGNVYELLSAERTRCVSGPTASKSPAR